MIIIVIVTIVFVVVIILQFYFLIHVSGFIFVLSLFSAYHISINGKKPIILSYYTIVWKIHVSKDVCYLLQLRNSCTDMLPIGGSF